MLPVREPRLNPVSLADLRPTQITVGMREVREKRKRWEETKPGDGADFLGKHMIPVILGPRDRHYVIDHHHLGRALLDAGVKDILVSVVANLSKLDNNAFWIFLDNRGWTHPFDDKGQRRAYGDVPKRLTDLVDDPFRSLAGELRRAGGYAKDTTPFAEFLWADFLRRRLKRQAVEKDFEQALEKAVQLARGEDADFLPGWCGPIPEN
ncbi:MAG TPA: ParB-like protein [Methylovirgula sp.]